MSDRSHVWSRRTFLGALAALPVVAYLPGRAAAAPKVVVVGAGAFGGWTALHLRRMGADVTLLDAWGPGNPRASSGGETRVIRAIYGPDRIYVELVRRSFELWEELQQATGRTLYTETGALWMHRGDDAYVRSALPILEEFGFAVESIRPPDAARRYPQINFDGVRTAYLETRAGALSAREACRAVRDRFVSAGGTYRTARALPGSIAERRMNALRLGDGSVLKADHYVFACGPWLGKLFPGVLGDRIQPTRQEVYYFGPPPGDPSYGPGRLPVWIDFGERVFYGLPDVHGRGFKIADDTRGEPFDPSTGDRTPSAEGIARARRLLAERFPGLRSAPLVEARVCQYENSPDGHLIVDRHPEAGNVWLVGGGSGHGFKLSPALGERVARQVLEDAPVEPFFSLERLREVEGGATQMDSEGEDR